MSEKRIYQLLEWCLWFLNPLLLMLAIFDQRIQPDLFFQWIGKFHPLVLHFPVVFGILIALYFLFSQNRRFPIETEKWLLAINAFLASVAAICGILLSVQNAYESDLVNLHKWGGVAIALFSWLLLYFLNFKTGVKKIISVFFLIILIGATHKGAQLTHGVNALSFPENTTTFTKEISDSSATIYELAVAPILEQKCVGCHGNDKVKGNLQLNSPENILKGGKDGNILKNELNKQAMLLNRIHLPQTEEKHMPPDGKLQLTSEELSIMSKWIKSGGNFKIKLNDLSKEDSLIVLVKKFKSASGQATASIKDLPDLAEFNSDYCTVNYLFNGSDQVEANFFQGSFYEHGNLKKLDKLKDQLIYLNMQGMPLKKEDLDVIVQFKSLEKLNLNDTKLDIGSLEVLKTLPKLRAVSICGIEFDETALNHFLDHSRFTTLNVWSKTASEKMLETVILKYPAIKITVGDNLENEVMKISNPSIEQDSSIISNHLDIRLKHLLKGVELKYTTDGSEPDSLKSLAYSSPIRISENTVLKVKAFKPGWISSNIVQRTFYKSEIHPDTIFLVTAPDPKYRSEGAKALVDYELGESNISNGKWLAYQKTDLVFVIGFKEPKSISSAHFNALVDTGPHIFPIHSIEVWGGNDGNQFSKITSVKFPEAGKNDPRGVNTFTCEFPGNSPFKYYKFIVSNLKKLPQWHSDKGKPAWIFIDELFLN